MKTTYEFEVACKNAIMEHAALNFKEKYAIQDISLVWMCKTLGNMKAILIDNGDNQRMYECSYNGAKEELYFDVYEKQTNICYPLRELKLTVD